MSLPPDSVEARLRWAWRWFLREGQVRSAYEGWEEKRQGRARFLSVMIPVQDDKLIARVQAVQECLRAIPYLDLHPPASLHLTVRSLGFLVTKRAAPDEIDDKLLPHVLAALVEVARATSPFPIALRRVNSWDTAPFVEARSQGRITALRAALAAQLPFLQDFAYRGGFMPHLTLGYYNADAPSGAAVAALRPLRYARLGSMTATCLCVVESQAEDLCAPFTLVERFDLG